MASSVTFLLGLAGSGKSHLARDLERETGAKQFEGIAATDKAHLLEEMIRHLESGGSCTVEEIAFCCASNRERIVARLKARVPDVEISWVCFDNDLEGANWNVRHRPDVGKEDVIGHLNFNAQWNRRYTYPPGMPIRPIFRIPERSNEAV